MDVSTTVGGFVPAGAMLDYAGTTAPSGWLLCDGSTVSRVTYARLFEVIGEVYGAGDGSTTFKLPDYRGRVAVGSGTGSSLSARTNGQAGGAETHTLTEGEMPNHGHASNPHSHGVTDPGHSHVLPLWSPVGSGTNFTGTDESVSAGSRATNTSGTGISVNSTSATVQNTGGGAAHNNMPPYLVATKIIRY